MQLQLKTTLAVASNDPAKHRTSLETICVRFTEVTSLLTFRFHIDFQCCQPWHNIIFAFCIFKVKSSVTFLLHTVADEPTNERSRFRQIWMRSPQRAWKKKFGHLKIHDNFISWGKLNDNQKLQDIYQPCCDIHLSTTVARMKNLFSISIITSCFNTKLLTKCLQLKSITVIVTDNFLSPNTAKTSPVDSFVLLLPGGVLVEDHRVSHNYQQGPGTCHGHIESLQCRYTHVKKGNTRKLITSSLINTLKILLISIFFM